MMRSSILGASTMLNVLIQHLPLQSLFWTKLWRAFRASDPSTIYSLIPPISSVWDYVPARFLLCRTCGGIAGIKGDRRALIAWTGVQAIVDLTCALNLVKVTAIEDSPADTWMQMECPILIEPTIVSGRAIFINQQKYHEGIMTLSRHDRDPIAARSWSDRCAIVATITSN